MSSLDAARSKLVGQVVAAVDAGITGFDELLAHCLAETELAAITARAGRRLPYLELFIAIESSQVLGIDPAGHVYRMDELTDGRVATHRLSQSEVDEARLDVFPDLIMVILGSPEAEKTHDFRTETWRPPDGLLAPFEAGDLVAFTRTEKR